MLLVLSILASLVAAVSCLNPCYNGMLLVQAIEKVVGEEVMS